MNKYRDLERLKEIKILLKTGQISYDQAELQAKEYIDNINIKIAKLSKRMKQKPRFISFSSFMR
jgi:predicted nucleotidyltransferase